MSQTTVAGSFITVNTIDSDQYVDGSIDNAHLADDAVGADELAANAVVNASVASNAQITFNKMVDLTTSRALVSDGNGDVSVSAVTSTEISYLDGVTSAIQAQIDAAGGQSFTGDTTITSGNLVIATAGKGIDFSAQTPSSTGTVTSEILDHYEEGTWTPVITDQNNNATMHGDSGGVYVKIGRMVTISANVQTSSLGSVSGATLISGLPFAVSNNASNRCGIAVGRGLGLAITSGQVVGANIGENSTLINLMLWDTTIGTTELQATEWTADGNIYIGGTYSV